MNYEMTTINDIFIQIDQPVQCYYMKNENTPEMVKNI